MRKNMQSVLLKRAVLISAFVFAVGVVVPISANAARAEEVQKPTQVRPQEGITESESRRNSAKTRLADAKLKACQNRERTITKILSRISDRGTKQLEVFNKIAERTKEFYVTKGKTLSNYDDLVAEVDAKKAAAEAAVEAIKSSSIEFACDGEDPKGTASMFKESLKAEIAALKNYKTAVKNLIVGVKSAQGATSSEGSQQ